MGATMAAKSWCLIIAGLWRAGLLAAQLPGADALAGRARVVGWSGDLDRAERLWRAALALHPDDAELLFGLAQTLYWHDQPALAEAYLTRARRVAPGDNEVRDLARTLRALLRPDVRTSVDGAGDSDHNDFVAQDATVTGALGSAVRGTLRAGWRRATDQAGHGSSYGGGDRKSTRLNSSHSQNSYAVFCF